MRTARDDDPDVPTQPAKTTRHSAFVPGPNKFVLAAAETRAAKNGDGVVNYFSRVRLWTGQQSTLLKLGMGIWSGGSRICHKSLWGRDFPHCGEG